jgi:chemotaxis protein methyltransferase CheR
LFHPSDHDADLTEEEFRLLRDYIHERFGLFFEESQRHSLRTRLAGRLSSLDLLSYEDYYRYLRFGPQREEELERMISHLTNNETYFYREVTQLRAFVEQVVPRIKEQKIRSGEKSLRILSAGCSTGEEVHTLAMMLHDSGQFFWGWQVEVIGLDVDALALEKARRGLYFHNSFRALPPQILERHFAPEGNGHVVKDSIRRMVKLRRGNLLDPESYAGLPRLDVVVCRNVLIYFSDDAMLRAVRLFGEALAPGGYLLLGHAESLARLTDSWTPIRFQGAVIYRSQGSGA